jgi:hypothetical protein
MQQTCCLNLCAVQVEDQQVNEDALEYPLIGLR